MTARFDRNTAEERFRLVFSYLPTVTAYAHRRGSPDADAIAAEAMAIAWRRLADVPADDPLPWLFVTARNLLLADARRRRGQRAVFREREQTVSSPEGILLDSQVEQALQALRPLDREALLLIAWEDLTPSQAARALGVSPTSFRVRLLRARRRLQNLLDAAATDANPSAHLVQVDVEGT
jgi:RNA polymerase sigma factor (sigma-70 family)